MHFFLFVFFCFASELNPLLHWHEEIKIQHVQLYATHTAVLD